MNAEDVRVHRPPADLALRFACAITRKLGDAAQFPAQAWIHANTYACLNVVTAGRVRAAAQVLPPSFLTGPFSAPVETCADGRLESICLVFQPWLLEDLFAVKPEQLTDRLVDTRSLSHAGLEALCRLLGAVSAGEKGIDACWDHLRGLRYPGQEPDLAFEVLRTQGVEAAAAQLGCVARQYRRRFVQRVGLSPLSWARIRRWEDTARSLVSPEGGCLPLAELSAAAGYADQSHMSRDILAFARKPPAQLQRAVAQGQGHWALEAARL